MNSTSRFAVGFAVACLAVTASATHSDAYEARTHREVSSTAFEASHVELTLTQYYGIGPTDTFRSRVLSFAGGPYTAQEWVRLGGSAEDVPFWRVLNHFYDPISGLGSGILGAVPAPDWALEDVGDLDGQSHSFKDAREAFYRGLTESDRTWRERELGHTFYSLGHVIHLIQDMAQPQHTRNDLHPPFSPLASLIEEYVNRNVVAFELTGAPTPFISGARDLWRTEWGAGLAEFSNANFVSAGTNFTALRDGATAERYRSPVLDLALRDVVSAPLECRDGVPAPGTMTFYGNTFPDPWAFSLISNPRMTTHSIFDQYLIDRGKGPIFALNCFNIDAAADILLPRAVSYSAALLRYFFRGRLGINMPDTRFLLSNETPGEDLDGRFELYYDTADGTRRRLASGPLTLAPNQVTGTLESAAVPDGVADPCFIVFRGRMGPEADAVAGLATTCPRASQNPPVPPLPPDLPPTPPGDAPYGYKVYFIENLYPQLGYNCTIVTPVDGVTWQYMLGAWFFQVTQGVYAVIRTGPVDECWT